MEKSENNGFPLICPSSIRMLTTALRRTDYGALPCVVRDPPICTVGGTSGITSRGIQIRLICVRSHVRPDRSPGAGSQFRLEMSGQLTGSPGTSVLARVSSGRDGLPVVEGAVNKASAR